MKKFISFAAYVLFASVVALSLTACSDDDKDENGGGSKFGTQAITVGGVSFKMIAVKGGTFQMGSPASDTDAYGDERPQHAVTLSDFYMGETEVTQALWKAVMDGANPSYFKGDNLPVEKVSWNDCQLFITKLNQLTGKTFRLPTEAEWEYAARGGSKSKGYKYAGSDDINLVAWYADNSDNQTQPVGKKTPNELGIYDMSGNVWEWCQDWFSDSFYGTSQQADPCNDNDTSASYRVLRGGCWSNYAQYCRMAYRRSGYPGSRYFNYGVRLVLAP